MPGERNGQQSVDAALRESLTWRCIGPHRGGRVVAVAADPDEPMTFYFGACAGGVWKTTDGGTYWENVSDGYFKTAAVGAIAVAQSDPNVIYVGTGETTIRGNVSHGDGVYKSTDGGKTWANVGLVDTRHIAKIRVHPTNPDLLYVAALGHAFGPNEERGVYRSRDGGKSWDRVLFRDSDTGACDLAMDPHNPRVLYAALWQVRRNFWSLTSGGPGCGLFRSTDGGDSWTELTRNQGLPKGVIGKIGIAVSPAKEGRVWALVEAEDGAVFRSDDAGATWQRLSEQGDLRWRAWYYMHIYAHPTNPETVYVLNGAAWKSTDGGATFVKYPTPHGDNHDLWIDPKNPRRMIQGDDGGAYVTFNDMDSWSTIFNQPTAQFYHVITDNQVPYRIYGSQQDNTAMSLPSFSPLGAITAQDFFEPGGGESGYIAVNPKNPDIIFGGAIGSGAGNGRLTRYDRRTGQERNVTVWPDVNSMGNGAKELKYRFQWTFPLFYSAHEQDALYATSNVVHRTTDEGQNWSVVSPDLTRNDATKMEASGGPITKDNTGAEVYGTIFAFVESPHERGVFWAGSDDGVVHISRDGCQTWENITPDIPEWALISVIEPSPHDPATAYMAATRYKLDDYTPYLFKTNDYGKTWQRITNGIRENDFTRVIREDPARRGLLYAGTETGVYVSFDDGGQWQALPGNLPVCPIHDLIVKDSDLIAATHGRSFWVLDDVTPLRQYTDDLRDSTTHLFTPRDFTRLRVYKGYGSDPGAGMSYRMAGTMVVTYKQKKKPNGETEEKLINAGENPPDGVIVRYFLKEKPTEPITLTFLDERGGEIRSLKSKVEQTDAEGKKKEESEAEKKQPVVPAEAGLNRFVWDTRYAEATRVPGDTSTEDAVAGPVVVPGTYQVRLTVGNETQTATFKVAKDPRVDASQRDLEAQRDFLLQLRDKLTETHEAILMLRDVRAQAEGWEKRLKDDESGKAIVEAAKALREKTKAIEDELIEAKADSPLQPPIRLNAKLATLAGFVNCADVAPSQQSQEVLRDISGRIDRQLRQLDDLMEADLASFNRQVREAGIAAIVAQP